MATSRAQKYEMRIYWSADDEAFVVEVPDLPGCMAHGTTRSEAAANAEDAINLWLDVAGEFGDAVPKPRKRHRAS